MAILRAIEASYGKVISLNVVRDTDSLLPTNTIFMTLLEPIDLGKRHLHEIPAPVSELGDKERYGGPSLDDVRRVLASPHEATSSRPAQSSNTGSRGRAQGNKSVITFEIEARRNAGRTRTMKDDPTYRTMTIEMIKEDQEILDALEQFEGGFFGGFEGVADRHRKVLERLEPSARSSNESSQPRRSVNARRDFRVGGIGGQRQRDGGEEPVVSDGSRQTEVGSV